MEIPSDLSSGRGSESEDLREEAVEKGENKSSAQPLSREKGYIKKRAFSNKAKRAESEDWGGITTEKD